MLLPRPQTQPVPETWPNVTGHGNVGNVPCRGMTLLNFMAHGQHKLCFAFFAGRRFNSCGRSLQSSHRTRAGMILRVPGYTTQKCAIHFHLLFHEHEFDDDVLLPRPQTQPVPETWPNVNGHGNVGNVPCRGVTLLNFMAHGQHKLCFAFFCWEEVQKLRKVLAVLTPHAC